jgi:hypothetical protein
MKLFLKHAQPPTFTPRERNAAKAGSIPERELFATQLATTAL